MSRTTPWIVALGLVLGACAGEDAASRAQSDASQAAAAGQAGAGEAVPAPADEDGFNRESFTLCPAIEPHRDELAGMVGFEQDPDESIALSRTECVIRGDFGAFVRVSLLPTFVRSVSMHANSIEAESTPARELGDDALFIDGALQPHVVFSLGSLIIDVDAAAVTTPGRAQMVALASRVRDILAEANS